MIDQSHDIKVTDKEKTDVAKFIYLLEKKHIHIDIIEYDSKFRNYYWHRKSLEKYLKSCDENIQSVCERMLA